MALILKESITWGQPHPRQRYHVNTLDHASEAFPPGQDVPSGGVGDEPTSPTSRRKVASSEARLAPTPTTWLCGEQVLTFKNSPREGHVFIGTRVSINLVRADPLKQVPDGYSPARRGQLNITRSIECLTESGWSADPGGLQVEVGHRGESRPWRVAGWPRGTLRPSTP